MSCPPACLHLCPACPERGTACRQEVRTQQKQKGREEKTLPSLCHKPTNQKKKKTQKKRHTQTTEVHTHFEVQRPEFGSIHYFANVLVGLVKDQRLLSEEAVG